METGYLHSIKVSPTKYRSMAVAVLTTMLTNSLLVLPIGCGDQHPCPLNMGCMTQIEQTEYGKGKIIIL
jgi:hypothetical protein